MDGAHYVKLLAQSNLVVTSLLVGLIWVIQLIVYPSFQYIDSQKWQSFHNFHTRRISYMVTWLMPLELLISGLLLASHGLNIFNILMTSCVLIIWLSTFLIQVPIHNRLTHSREIQKMNLLVQTNWIRTLVWTFKLGLMLTCFNELI